MPTINIKNVQINYSVTYNKRRINLRLKAVPPANIEVAAPAGFPAYRIEEVLRTKSDWILSQLAKLAETQANPVNSSIQDGAELLFCGQIVKLRLEPSAAQRAKVALQAGTMTASLPKHIDRQDEQAVATVLKKWYISSARRLLTERTAYWATQIGVRPQKISIREQKTRWGSCSHRANINYNWRIIMAPPAVIDYLVVHELCHIKMPNHSKDFWLLVGQSAPDYKQHRAWLRRNAALLTRILSI
jgi:predicted metal-dependent hydrolase